MEAILALRIVEKRIEKNKKTHLAYIDIMKTFDNALWQQKLYEILNKVGISYYDHRLTWNLCKNWKAVIRSGTAQEEANIGKGNRQNCSLSLALFNGCIYI